jgi:hypothetical protein
VGNVANGFSNFSACHVEVLQDVDGRDRPGHDELSCCSVGMCAMEFDIGPLNASWPGLARPSTSLRRDRRRKVAPVGNVASGLSNFPARQSLQDVDGRDRPGHDGLMGLSRVRH